METCNLEALLGYIGPSQNTKDWECDLMVEYLSSIHKTLGLVPNSLINQSGNRNKKQQSPAAVPSWYYIILYETDWRLLCGSCGGTHFEYEYYQIA